jgi:polysaccharide pyruvyl transferase WcaK-like protein
MQPNSIVFYGNFGAGNLGNECTLQTAIEQTRTRLPHVKLLCVCPDPEDVRARHGIAAAASQCRDSGWSWADLDPRHPGHDLDDIPPRDRGAAARGPRRRRLGAQLARLARIAFLRAPQEFVHWCKMLRVVARSDVLLVPGTGIVTDACGSLAWPYDMFKLTLLARLCRVRVVFLSVGAGPFRHRLGCWFIRRSLRFAHYRSYRDVDSKRRLEDIGFKTGHDVVYPDLVFGLSRSDLTAKRTHTEPGRVVGLGLKDYATPVDDADAQSYRDYLGVMADFVLWLQAQRYTVRLIIGDAQYDTRVRQDLLVLLKARAAGAQGALLLSEPVPTVEELLRQLRETDAVVSPRYHNLVLALMLNKPVIALSDLPKVDALLNDLGLGRFCLPLEGLKTEELTGRFVQLQSDAENLKPHIGAAVEKYRHSVDEQYLKVYGNTANPPGLCLPEGSVRAECQ